MRNRTLITYPRNWTEARRIFKSLDIRWSEIMKSSDKRSRSREWLNLVSDVNTLYQAADEHATSINKELEIKRELYESASIIEKPALFAAMMGTSGILSFHQKLARTTMQWMKHKKIPKSY